MPSLAEIEATRDAAMPELAPAAPVTAEVEAAPATELSMEGAIPAVAAGDPLMEPGATASEQAYGDQPAAAAAVPHLELKGMYKPAEYKAACEAAGTPEKWHDDYARGHTNAGQWVQPYEGRYDMTFKLKKEHSASQAIKDFLQGPTVADFPAMEVAIDLDDLRDTMGDRKFDRLFGSADPVEDARIAQRLAITSEMYTTPFVEQMEALAAEHDAAEHAEEPEPPQIAAAVDDRELTRPVEQQPAPEFIAEELGIEREHESDFA